MTKCAVASKFRNKTRVEDDLAIAEFKNSQDKQIVFVAFMNESKVCFLFFFLSCGQTRKFCSFRIQNMTKWISSIIYFRVLSMRRAVKLPGNNFHK